MKNKEIDKLRYRYIAAILSLLSVFVINSCSTTEVDYGQYTAQQIYDLAEERYAKKDYEYAAEAYASIDKNYPYSPLSAIGLLKGAISYYEDKKYIEALDLIDKYLTLNSNSADAPQAMYIQASCYIAQIKILQRDQFETKEALSVIERMNKLYPDNKYTQELVNTIPFLKNQLAGKIMETGKEELRINNFAAAINNFQDVIKTYPDTAMVPEALYRLMEAYTSMELYDYRKKVMQNLTEKYTDNEWTKRGERLIESYPETYDNVKKINYVNGNKVSEITGKNYKDKESSDKEGLDKAVDTKDKEGNKKEQQIEEIKDSSNDKDKVKVQ